MKQLKKSKRPVVLSVKGKAAAICAGCRGYQRLLDIAAQCLPRKASPGPGRRENRKITTVREFSKSLKPSMAYVVRIFPRAERDLASLYEKIGAEHVDAALRGIKASESLFSASRSTESMLRHARKR